MKIQAVARRTNLSIFTLRYYEQAGLLPQIRRGANGHRDYTEDDVYRIVFITRLRATGMPIADIRHYVELSLQGEETIAERLRILEEHRAALEQNISQLRENLELISSKIEHYREWNHMQHAQKEGAAPPEVTASQK